MVTCSLQTGGSVSFKPCQTFEEAAPFFPSHLINHLTLCFIKIKQAYILYLDIHIHTVHAHTSPGCSSLGRSPLTDRQKDQRGWVMEREAERRGIEGWGITIIWMTAYRCLGLPDNLSAASTPSGSRWYQTTSPLLAASLKELDRNLTAGWERRYGKLKRRGRCLTKSERVSAPLHEHPFFSC